MSKSNNPQKAQYKNSKIQQEYNPLLTSSPERSSGFSLIEISFAPKKIILFL
ncbi:MAG: hypothetical protein AAFQ80_10770 [Cyanobacteria bacterium J06621_8]